MCLGRFVFGLRTAPFAELSQAHQWRWASNQRFAQDPALQYVGRGESSLDLPCRLAPEITGGYSNIKLLQTMANRGEPYILLRGNGEVLGYWVIKEMQIREGDFFSDGVAQRIDFNLNLQRYSEQQGAIGAETPLLPLITRLF